MTAPSKADGSRIGFRVLKLAFSNPHAQVIEETPSLLTIHLPDFPGDLRRGDEPGTRVAVRFDNNVIGVDVSRSLFTSNQVYLVPDGPMASLVVTDHFLTALRHCRPDRRAPDDDALIDHFLFRTVPGEKTYACGVTRLGHGRTAHWNTQSPRLEVATRQRVERPETLPARQALEVLEQSLENVVSLLPHAAPGGPVTNLLSGGVDSTLLQALLPKATRSLSVAIDTPEFEPENERALAASKLTGSQHRVVPMREAEYLQAVERFVSLVGLPPHHMQSVLLGELFRLYDGDKACLLTAQLADALFGLNSLARPAARLRRWGWVPRLTCRLRISASLKPKRLHSAESWMSLLSQPVGSTRGLAARAACYTDFAFLEKVFGTAAVERRLAERLAYVLELCPFLSPAATGPQAQLEAAHLVDYFCDDALSIWRQAAMSHGAYLVGPFTHPAIFRCSLLFPRMDRYSRKGEIKPALKAILRKRLPTYDTRQRKLSFGLPLQRFLDAGPLKDCRYLTPPDSLPLSGKVGSNAYPLWIAWNVVTLSAWQALAVRGQADPPLTFCHSFTQ